MHQFHLEQPCVDQLNHFVLLFIFVERHDFLHCCQMVSPLVAEQFTICDRYLGKTR